MGSFSYETKLDYAQFWQGESGGPSLDFHRPRIINQIVFRYGAIRLANDGADAGWNGFQIFIYQFGESEIVVQGGRGK